MESFSLTPAVQVYPCPNCYETINTSMQLCPFCKKPIDARAAQTSADATSRISRACSDASYLKIMLGLLVPFAALTLFLPFLGLLGFIGFLFIKYATPIMTIRWWFLYGRIRTTDPDFSKARGAAILVSVVALLVLIFIRVHVFGFPL